MSIIIIIMPENDHNYVVRKVHAILLATLDDKVNIEPGGYSRFKHPD